MIHALWKPHSYFASSNKRVNYQRFLIAPVAALERTFVFEDPSRVQSYLALRSSSPRDLPLFLFLCDRHTRNINDINIKLKRFISKYIIFVHFFLLVANKLNLQQIIFWELIIYVEFLYLWQNKKILKIIGTNSYWSINILQLLKSVNFMFSRTLYSSSYLKNVLEMSDKCWATGGSRSNQTFSSMIHAQTMHSKRDIYQLIKT